MTNYTSVIKIEPSNVSGRLAPFLSMSLDCNACGGTGFDHQLIESVSAAIFNVKMSDWQNDTPPGGQVHRMTFAALEALRAAQEAFAAGDTDAVTDIAIDVASQERADRISCDDYDEDDIARQIDEAIERSGESPQAVGHAWDARCCNAHAFADLIDSGELRHRLRWLFTLWATTE